MGKFIAITRGTIFNTHCRVIELLDKEFVYLDKRNKPQVMGFHYWKQFAELLNGHIYVKEFKRTKVVSYPVPKTFFKLDQ